MMTTDAGLPAASRAVLIGVSAYEYAEFPPIRAARNSLQAMQSLLADPALCGWPPELITVIPNPLSAADLADRVADLAETTSGVLLLYYVGHGVLSMRGELCLTVTSTRPNRPKITGLPWETLSDVLRACPARIRLVILDCCFAGQAIEALGTDGDPGLADITHIDGVYTLTATTRNRTAHVPPASAQDTACTSFTGELQDLIQSGVPGKPGHLTFGDIYPELRQRLRAKGLPAPSQRGTDTAHQFPFTANNAARPDPAAHVVQAHGKGYGSSEKASKNVESGGIAGTRQARILADALRAAWLIDYAPQKASVLMDIAQAVAATDPLRAAGLTNDSERVAQSITDWDLKESALREIALTVAATDPDRAERIAQSMSISGSGTLARIDIAQAMAPTYPDRAAQLTNDAEWLARSITDARSRASVLIDLAQAVATNDPDRAVQLTNDAERVAQSISDKRARARILSRVVKVAAASDADRAERIARSIRDKDSRASALTDIAQAMAATDNDRAIRLATDAQRITRRWDSSALASIIEVMAATDPDSAERFASQHASGSVTGPELLARIVKVVAASDPDRAERIAQSIGMGRLRDRVLANIVEAVAASDPDRAERIAQSITDKPLRASSLAGIVKLLAATDPDRTGRLIADIESIAQSITDNRWKEGTSRRLGNVEHAPALVSTIQAVAATDADASERLAQSITDEHLRASALATIVKAVAASDPDRAERLAQSITKEYLRASALATIVKAVAVGNPDHAA